MMAIRAYFEFLDVLASVDSAASRIKMTFGGETTGIGSVKSEEIKVESYYNLSGQRVAKPAKGVYVKGEKKVVVK